MIVETVNGNNMIFKGGNVSTRTGNCFSIICYQSR